MNKHSIFLIFSTFLFFAQISAEDVRFSFDRKERGLPLPKYRSCPELHASASGQPTESDFLWIQAQVPKEFKIIVVDLRKEGHGYLNGEPILWNRKEEAPILEKLAKQQSLQLSDRSGGNFMIIPESVSSEQKIVERLKMEYRRFPSKHAQEPPVECVDEFLLFSDKLDDRYWLHLHCREGWSRTTLYFVMLDMLKNADVLSFDAIIDRQHHIGGADMKEEQELIKQYLFLKRFYTFSKLRKKGAFSLWSEYLKISKCDYKERRYLPALETINSNAASNQAFRADLPEILNQNFIYLGQGASSTAFLSEDGEFVLKLFKMRDAKNDKEVYKRFLGYRFAIEQDKENTGMLYWHLQKTTGLGTVNLFDKVEQEGKISYCLMESVPLNELIFALQLRAKNLGGLIKTALRKKDLPQVALYLNRIFDLYNEELEKDLLDIDPKFIYNMGFLEERPIRYDASHLRKFSDLSDKDLLTYKKGVLKHFAQWVQRGRHEGEGAIMETVVPWILQFPPQIQKSPDTE